MKNGTGNITAILFDKDGTLLDFDATWASAYRETSLHAARGDRALADRLLEQTGMDLTTGKSAAGSLLAAGNSAEIAAAWIACGADFQEGVLTEDLDRVFIGCMHDAATLPGVPEAVETLSATGFTLGVASSDSEAAIRAFLAGTCLAPRFAFVTGYDTGFGPKPEPGMVHGFAEATGLAPGRIAVVGDNTHDLEMARSAGAGLCIGVLTGTSARHDLESLADAVLDSVADLPAYLSCR
ncbi:probable phosphoglycolate phosphatase protein [Roseibium aggregatum IAM 12614]|uniref:phosphoglycolate phosphatase n=1 Tax=Roseibium aggregatum (strain ATCC 25650 / DSM 13394 / JCM 20685 / NBRC 16684 / NCIMB 2208 / IAM 12614 / B1) TaxID=384765 RepID=A0NP66_ROSAI|nr:HAD family hydrolase [Roseibium aggregatum]EAV45229.1 probable phosphoglycolate phosphatase protein [Roseibium aggregatum IAM 12614]